MMHVSHVTNMLIEHNFFEYRHDDTGIHGEGISMNKCGLYANNIIRYNTFKDIRGTGVVVIKELVQGHMYIYGNLFYCTDPMFTTSNGVIANTGGGDSQNTYMHVYNNTMVNCYGLNTGVRWQNEPITGNVVFNNLWYNCENVSIGGVEDAGYNYIIDSTLKYGAIMYPNDIVTTGDPFANSSSHDYRLALPTEPGLTLTAPFQKDLKEETRGSDGVWDRGAFEYLSPYIIESVTIKPNSGYVKVGTSIIITAVESHGISGLTSTPAAINGKQISLVDQGDGTYVGVYTIAAGDAESTNVEAINIRLMSEDGVSSLASSSGSTLSIDLNVPTITSITLTPDSGWLKAGEPVLITVTAGNNESGLIPSQALINGTSLTLSDQGDGTYTGTYVVQPTDPQGVYLLATNIYLSDLAGNKTGYTSSPRSKLKVDTYVPAIASVTINPVTGSVSVGGSVSITVTTENNESGLIASDALINGNKIPLTDSGDGTYTGTYIVGPYDEEGMNIEATGITLTDAAGNVGDPAASSGSTLNAVIPHIPAIVSVTITPGSGFAKVGDTIVITVTEKDNETGLTPSDANINGKQVALNDQGNGTYMGMYTVMEGDNDAVNVEATDITLTGVNGTSTPVSSVNSSLIIDAHTPVISTVTISPDNGWIKAGHKVGIVVTADNNETGLTASRALINDKYISLTGQGDGSYTGSYSVQLEDAQGINIEAVNITLTDSSGNSSESASSKGSTLKVDTIAPVIESVTISPDSGVAVIDSEVIITVKAEGNEADCTASDTLINGENIQLFDQHDGTYQGIYTVQPDDDKAENVEATSITLLDAAGNISQTASSRNSSLSIRPDIEKADFNRDGYIDLADLVLFGDVWGSSPGDEKWNQMYDLNGDKLINLSDLVVIGNMWSIMKAPHTLQGTSAKNSTQELPQDFEISITTEIDTHNSLYYVTFAMQEIEKITGFGLTVSYDTEALEYIEENTKGLTGLYLTKENNGFIDIASLFMDEDFGGSFTIILNIIGSEEDIHVDLITIRTVDEYGNLKNQSVHEDIEVDDNDASLFDNQVHGFSISPAHPNPSNPSTTIQYEIPENSHVRLVIYDILGREVSVLTDTMISAGTHEAVWDGRNYRGETVGSGVYIYQLIAGTNRAQGKVMFLR